MRIERRGEAPLVEPRDQLEPGASVSPAGQDVSVFAGEAALIELKQQLSLDGQRETLRSNVSSIYHRSAMAIIGNCKA